MRTDTVTAVITPQDILLAESEYVVQLEEERAMDRLIGTYETYGAWSSGKPKLSKESYVSIRSD